jgi:hypothetical protein
MSKSKLRQFQDCPNGAERAEIGFGPALPDDDNVFAWVDAAQGLASAGTRYEGRTSPFWYDVAVFHELLLAHEPQLVRSLITQFDGCSGGKAGEIVRKRGMTK